MELHLDMLPLVGVGLVVGYILGRIHVAQKAMVRVQRFLRSVRNNGKRTIYTRPPALTQEEQVAWLLAVQEVDPGVTDRQLLGLDTFCCVECKTEPTHEMLCALCVADHPPISRK